jgi:hypothetical protein
LSEAYRQKLLNWLLSMLVLLLMATGGISALLLAGRFNPVVERNLSGPLMLPAMAAENLFGFMLYFVPVAIWHLADLPQRRVPESGTLAILTSYRPFGGILLLGTTAFALSTSQILTTPNCPELEPETFGFIDCTFGPPRWLWFAMLIPLLFVYILSMGKAVLTIRSRFKKAS